MNWWTSIAFYLWQNSLNRWLEQPIVVLSKLAISGLIGISGAVVMLGSLFLGDELTRQLESRDALAVHVYEVVPDKWVSHVLGGAVEEELEWGNLASEVVVLNQVSSMARSDHEPIIPVYAVRNLEAMGYPDSIILISPRMPEGLMTPVTIRGMQVVVTAMPPNNQRLKEMVNRRDLILASVSRLTPLLQNGFTRQMYFQADSIESIERIDQVVSLMRKTGERRISMRSSLALLIKLREIRDIQGLILIVVTIGAAAALGLIGGALAWMEFREERYLLALIRSFGVGSRLLLLHSLIENCLVALMGVLLGLLCLTGVASLLQDGSLKLLWLDAGRVWDTSVLGVLLLGALLGGLLSCVPVAVGLRKPVGLILQ